VSERPILFSSSMVRALLAGTKTQTRRVVKPMAGQQSKWLTPALLSSVPAVEMTRLRPEDGGALGVQLEHPKSKGSPLGWVRCPCGEPGDHLWVRETWAYRGQASLNYGPKSRRREGFVTYAADDARVTHYFEEGPVLPCPKQQLPMQREDEDEWEFIARKDEYLTNYFRRMRPSIRMPRWASRITLEVTGVRVERLQAITEADAVAEGVECAVGRDVPPGMSGVQPWRNYLKAEEWRSSARSSYRSLWESINGPGSWAVNPWVWVVSFKVVKP
jgi:hypothetical protein